MWFDGRRAREGEREGPELKTIEMHATPEMIHICDYPPNDDHHSLDAVVVVALRLAFMS